MKSVLTRLDTFEQEIADNGSSRARLEVVEAAAQCAIRCPTLALERPDGSPLIAIENLELVTGEMSLVTGRSGMGKSTLLRALAGIWPHAGGRIEIPCGARLMVLPQRPYFATRLAARGDHLPSCCRDQH